MQDSYISRINKVLTYIDEHLDRDLSLETLAGVAFYSPYHLHRLFRAITGEPLNAYVMRKRIERTAIMLVHNSECSIADIRIKYGFQHEATFSRTFRKLYGQSPTAFRNANKGNFSKIGKEDRNNGQDSFMTEEYLRNIEYLKNWIIMNAQVEIKVIPTMHLAYITHIGVAGIEHAFMQIVRWATPRGLLQQPNTHVCRVFHDSFKITDADKVRMSIGIATDQSIAADGIVELATIPAGKVLAGRFEIHPPEFETAWNSLFIWMNEHGYKKADRNPFEIYLNNPNDHPEKKSIVELYIPIE